MCVYVCICIYIKLGREIKRVRSRVKIAGARGGANIARARVHRLADNLRARVCKYSRLTLACERR